MAMLTAAALSFMLPLAVAGERPGFSLRTVGTFPEIELSKAASVHEWPFSVPSGTLTCVELNRQQVVLFSEPWRTDVRQEFGNMTLPRSVVVSTNPLAIMASLDDRELYLPFENLETLIRRLAPFEAIGRALCEPDQPKQQSL